MKKQKEIRKQLFNLLGETPAPIKVSGQTISTIQTDDYIIETLSLDLNGIEDVPAYFVRPTNATGKTPAVLFAHSHGGYYHVGKNELTEGNEYLQNPSYAKELSKLGYSALCIDMWAFGERRGRTEREIYNEMLWSGQVMWGMMIFDQLQALDYLCSRPDVDETRIASLGMSMGGTMSWWLAALDERIKVCIDICSLCDYESLIETRGLDLHSQYYYVPKLLQHFTTAKINRLISPRPHLSLAGIYDPLTPRKGLDIIDQELKREYAEAGSSEAWKLLRYPIEHFETAAMRKEALSFLTTNL
ncbi:dienelactone hydrolase family protein [Bacillus alkalicellulosilyticus]|uniref:dienelactone hydrolase family protein n=1 Tax=Alkalihalobacterium alkalicellulosilyticum TaxID=1912214 RepID=UPI0011163459|nr:acetylxylan esterase [Bacillus alkalicellulosilyticus]